MHVNDHVPLFGARFVYFNVISKHLFCEDGLYFVLEIFFKLSSAVHR